MMLMILYLEPDTGNNTKDRGTINDLSVSN